MTSLLTLVTQHMLVLFFVYGLAFFLFGITILLKDDKRSTIGLRSSFVLLAFFGLLHGMSEWSDMFLELGEAYWTPFFFRMIQLAGFYLGLASFVFLLSFGVRSIARDKPTIKWLERGSLIASLLFALTLGLYGIRTGMSDSWYVTSCVLARYFLAFPGSLLVAVGLVLQMESSEINEMNSSAARRCLKGLAVVFFAYALFAGIVVPKTSFPPATFINYASFQAVLGLPVQVFRTVCSVLAAFFVSGLLNALSAVSYGGLEKQIQQRTSELAKANEHLMADLAVRKRVEIELELSRDAALESSRVKSEFLANMSHEIRTPLNGVIGMTDLALDTDLTREQREYLQTVKISADSLLAVINEILDFSKIESGRIDLDSAHFNLRESLEATIKTLALRADEKGLELLCEIAPEVPEAVRGDLNRLLQIVVNLVGNAIKFTGEGEVVLRVKTLETNGEERLLEFTVSDTGIGIPLEKQKLIFEPFTQADNSTTRKYGGTGLGLTISARLVEMMGGTIWVESEQERGARFHFTVRLRTGDAQAARIGTGPSAETLPGLRVLIVDDNRTNRVILQGMLNRWDIRSTMAEGGEQALLELSAAWEDGKPFELILMDMHMPRMDGFSLVERIRQSPELATTTIMMLTSAGHRGDVARCQALGVAAYLLKPIRQSELCEAIVRVLEPKERRDPIPLTRVSFNDAHHSSSSLNILLAEDNVVNQRLAERLLQKRGHRVVLAANGREALSLLDKHAFDLVFMDVQMPEVDGLEATAAIRKSEQVSGKHQVVIALTAYAVKGDKERFLAAGMDGYLSKPIRTEELDAVLLDFLASRKDPAATDGNTVSPNPSLS